MTYLESHSDLPGANELTGSLAHGICGHKLSIISKYMHMLQIKFIGTSQEIVNATEPHWWWVKIGSGNGMVPQALPEPIVIYVAIWHH